MSDIKLTEVEEYVLKLVCNPNTYDTIVAFMRSQPSHEIDEHKMQEWVNNQPYEIFKETAQFICDNIKYIPVSQVIEKIEKLGDNLVRRHKKEDVNFVFFIMNYKEYLKKSNTFFNVLLLSYIFKKYKIYFPVTNLLNRGIQMYGYDVVYIDMDDMSYTGTQTMSILNDIYVTHIGNYVKTLELSNTDKKEILNCFREKLKYEVIRLYITESAISIIKESVINVIINTPKDNTYNEKLPEYNDAFSSTDNQKTHIYNAINVLFFNLRVFPASIIYFDHKIADLPSTCSFMLTTGYIPSTNLINQFFLKFLDEDGKINNPDAFMSTLINDKDILDILISIEDELRKDEKKEYKFINFVENCDSVDFIYKYIESKNKNIQIDGEIELQTDYGILNDNYTYETVIDDDIKKFINICPEPYYKTEEYNVITNNLIDAYDGKTFDIDILGNTPLHKVLMLNMDFNEWQKEQLQRESDKNWYKRNILGYTPLHYLIAYKQDCNDVSKKILERIELVKRCNNFTTYNGITLLHMAINKNNEEMVNYILDKCPEYVQKCLEKETIEMPFDFYVKTISKDKNKILTENTVNKLRYLTLTSLEPGYTFYKPGWIYRSSNGIYKSLETGKNQYPQPKICVFP